MTVYRLEDRRHPVTPEQHIKQRERVQGSLRLSGRRAERAQEAATIARLYPRNARTGVENVIPIYPLPARVRKPEPPLDAA